MEDKEKLEGQEKGRREFLSCLGSALASSAAAAAASAVATGTVASAAEVRGNRRMSATFRPVE